MTIGHVVKLEFYKFFHEKSYLYLFGTVALINILCTGILVNFENINTFATNAQPFTGLIIFSFFLLVIINFILLYWYPFHVLSIDYNNQVMGLLMASGIKRQQLFYAKLVTVLGLSLVTFIGLLFGPLVICIIKIQITSGTLDSVLTSIKSNLNGLQAFKFLLSYITTTIIMMYACILMKGAKWSILVFIGLSWLYQVIVTLITDLLPFDSGFGHNIVTMSCELLAILIFGFLAQNKMRRQAL